MGNSVKSHPLFTEWIISWHLLRAHPHPGLEEHRMNKAPVPTLGRLPVYLISYVSLQVPPMLEKVRLDHCLGPPSTKSEWVSTRPLRVLRTIYSFVRLLSIFSSHVYTTKCTGFKETNLWREGRTFLSPRTFPDPLAQQHLPHTRQEVAPALAPHFYLSWHLVWLESDQWKLSHLVSLAQHNLLLVLLTLCVLLTCLFLLQRCIPLYK